MKKNILFFSACLGVWFITFALTYPWFMSPIPLGWDTGGHVYLFSLAQKFLKSGSIFGYDQGWFGGFPTFQFYGFFPYLLGGLLPLDPWLVLRIYTAANLVFFPVAFSALGSTFFPKHRNFYWLFPVLSLGFLLNPTTQHLGMGINGSLSGGLVNSLFGLNLFCMSIARWHQQKWGRVLFPVVTIISHLITGIGLLGFLFLYSVIFKRLKTGLRDIALILLSTSYFLVNFFMYGKELNGEKLSALGHGSWLLNLTGIFFPFQSAYLFSLLIATMAGLSFFRPNPKNTKRLAMIFITGCFLIFSDSLFSALDLKLHYYRLLILFSPIYLLFAFQGYLGIPKNIRPALVLTLLITILFSVKNFSLETKTLPPIELESAEKIATFINSQNRRGTTFIENPSEHIQMFTDLFPRKYKIPIASGLLMESAPRANFIIPSIHQIAPDSLIWGGIRVGSGGEIPQVIESLRENGVEYLALRSAEIQKQISLLPPEFVESKMKTPSYELFQIKNIKPVVASLSHKPIAFFHLDGTLDAKILSSRLLQIPGGSWLDIVSFASLDLKRPQFASTFSTLIVSAQNPSTTLEDLARNFTGDKLFIILDQYDAHYIDKFEALNQEKHRIHVLSASKWYDVLSTFEKELRITKSPNPNDNPSFKMENWNKLTIDTPGDHIIQMTYFPWWNSHAGRIYATLGKKIFLHADLPTTLSFQTPLWLKILAAMCTLFVLIWEYRQYRMQKTKNQKSKVATSWEEAA